MTELAIRDESDYLAVVHQLRELVDRVENVVEAKDLAAMARAAQVWAKRFHLGEEQVNLAGIAKLWAERKAGELLAETPRNTGAAGIGTSAVTDCHRTPTLGELGVSKKESSRWQKLAGIPAPEFANAIEAARERGFVSAPSVIASSATLGVHFSSATDMWSTPQRLFDLLNTEFVFDLDVCATPENAKCDRFYTVADDGLAQTWVGVCWMNPPYGDEIVDWVQKASESAEAGATIVCLVPARVDTGWWWDYCRHGEIRFLRGRLKFGDGKNAAPFPSAVVVFPRPARVVWWERAA